MVSWRLRFWQLGAVVVVIVAAAGPSVGWPIGASALIGLLVWGLTGLIAEMAVLLTAGPRPAAVQLLADARPADGVVELAPLVGLEGVPNGHDARFLRFVRLGPAAPGPRKLDPRRRFPALRGRVVFCSLFVGRDGRGWSDAEVARTLGSLRTAAGWIERQAGRLGVPLAIELADTYFAADDPEVDNEVELAEIDEPGSIGLGDPKEIARTLASASRAAAALGFADAADLVARVEPAEAADVVVWLLHPRRAGRSIAIPADLSELPGVTLAVCYPRYADFAGPLSGPPAADPATIAHEILHLFGASDKYDLPLGSFPRGAVGARDIMRFDFQTLSAMRVDPLTAREIGWA